MAKLKTQLQNVEEIRKVLQEVGITWTWDKKSVDVRLIYLPCSNGMCDTTALFEVIKKSLMANFVFSHAQIQKKLAINQSEDADELFRKAVMFLSKKTAHGELGELILFTLLEVYLEAPKILSKVSQKSSPRMPVFGADAVHAQFVDDKFRLYLGEAKLYKSFQQAATQAVKSISNALDNYNHEFNLIETHINFPEIDREVESRLLQIMDPFDDRITIDDILHYPCFIGFAEPGCFEDEKSYLDNYKEIAANHIGDFYCKLTKKNKQHDKATLLMLPFSSITDVVRGFVKHMGISR